MPSRNILILTLLLVIAAVGVSFWEGGSDRRVRDPRVGQALVDIDDLVAVDKVTIKRGEKEFSFARSPSGRWLTVGDKPLPVDAKQVAKFLDDLSKMKLVRVVAEGEDQLASFGLEIPTHVVVQAADTSVVDVSFGSSGQSGGVYGRVGGEYKVYLLDPPLTVQTDVEAWEHKQFIQVVGEDIQSLLFEPVKGKAVSLVREEKGKPLVVEGLGEGEAAIDSAISSLDRLLTSVSYKQRVDLSHAEAKDAWRKTSSVTAQLFDGRRYEIHVALGGKDDSKAFMRVKAYPGASDDEAAKEALSMLNANMESWYYEVAPGVARSFIKSRADFVGEKKPATGG